MFIHFAPSSTTQTKDKKPIVSRGTNLSLVCKRILCGRPKTLSSWSHRHQQTTTTITISVFLRGSWASLWWHVLVFPLGRSRTVEPGQNNMVICRLKWNGGQPSSYSWMYSAIGWCNSPSPSINSFHTISTWMWTNNCNFLQHNIHPNSRWAA